MRQQWQLLPNLGKQGGYCLVTEVPFQKEIKMCPACYINGLLLLIFGATGAQIANNPWVIALSIVLTVGGFWWMWKAYKRNKGKGGLKSNLKMTLLVVLAFAGGYVTAAYQTHDFWQEVYGAEDHLN